MSKRLDLSAASKPERMRRTVNEIASRAVDTGQLAYGDAAIGAMYAAFDCYRQADLSDQASLLVMRKVLEAMARTIAEGEKAPLLDLGPGIA